jgi:hypothetical protein
MERGMQAAPAPDPEPVPEPAPYPRQPEPRDRTPVRPPPIDAWALLKIKPPPKFSGTNRRTTFRDWWMQVEEFLDSQPEEVIGGERRSIVWVSRLLEKEAQEWYLEWTRRVRDGQTDYNWQSFVDELRQRFTDDNEADLAYRELETMTYQRDIHTCLIRWDALCARAGVSGVAYRKMLLSAIGPTLRDRLERYDRANTDKEFRANVLNAGRNLEDWARERRREDCQRPVRASETPRPAPAPTSRPTSSARPVLRSQTVTPRELPRTANSNPPRAVNSNLPPRTEFERRFATVEEATKGVPEELLKAHKASKSCLRCGLGGHQATHCFRRMENEMPSKTEDRIAGLKRGEGDDDEEDFEEEDGIERESKRSRFEVAAPDAQETPLYEGYGSEDNFSD